MTIVDTTSLKDHHAEIVDFLIEKHSHLFPAWVNEVAFYYDDSNPGGASTCPSMPYRQTSIYLSQELFAQSIDKVERFLLHEMAHSYNEPILRIIHEYLPLFSEDDIASKLFHKTCLDAIEMQTEDLSILFSNLECSAEDE